jgi:hypothetical protein
MGLRGARTELVAAELIHDADIQDARRELRAVKDGLRKLELIDEFERSERDWDAPLN